MPLNLWDFGNSVLGLEFVLSHVLLDRVHMSEDDESRDLQDSCVLQTILQCCNFNVQVAGRILT